MTDETPGAAVTSETKPHEIDYELILQRLEHAVLQEADPARAAEILAKETVWKKLSSEQAVRWAKLAQAAGRIDLSLEVLEWVTAKDPDCVAAWKTRVALLEILGERGKKEAEKTPAPETSAPFPEDVSDEDLADPFYSLRKREEAVEWYLELFRGREDCFARQWVDRAKGTSGYVPVRRPMTPADVLDHLGGKRTYGIYLLQHDSQVQVGVIDADLVQRLRGLKVSREERALFQREKRYLLTRLTELSYAQGLPCLVEFSGGKGYHFWYLLESPAPAAVVRKALLPLAKRMNQDLSCFQLEAFPKQDRLEGKGLGNLVKLPLGIHRLTGRPSYFMHLQDRSPWVQLEALKNVKRIPPARFDKLPANNNSAEVVVHPRHQKWAKQYPELALLGDRCTALGQIFVDCRRSRTLSLREEKVLFGTIGFLPRARTLLHHLFRELPDYNPHLVDYKLSKLRGKPIGCKKIHSLLGLAGDRCDFERDADYDHPLLHWPGWAAEENAPKAERVLNLSGALEQLKVALKDVERFLPG